MVSVLGIVQLIVGPTVIITGKRDKSRAGKTLYFQQKPNQVKPGGSAAPQRSDPQLW